MNRVSLLNIVKQKVNCYGINIYPHHSWYSINLSLTCNIESGCGVLVETVGWSGGFKEPVADRSLQVLYPPHPTNYGGMARTHLDFIHISLAG